MKLFPFLGKKKYPVTVPQNRHAMNRGDIEHSVLDILGRLRRSGFQAHLVGGCVRDLLLGKKPKDFDIVTDARPQQIKRLFRRCFLIGRRFRLAHVYISHDRFVEVATFRAAVDPDQVPEGQRFAANNVYGTIDDDALRRDFTVNGLYYNSADGSIIDYGGGLEDLKKKVLRSIGEPGQRFREDPVRMIRAARFCAQLGFTPSKGDSRAAVACAPLIIQANAHRMLEELYKILRCGASEGTFRFLRQFNILAHWIPEIDPDKHPALFPRLAAVDRRRLKGEDIPAAVLLSALLYDLFDDAMGEKRGFQDAFNILHERCTEMVTRLRIPRKEWDAMCNLIARQSSLARIPDPRKGKSFEKRFLRNVHFPNALAFFEICAEAAGKYEAELKYWKERAARAREHEGMGPREESGRPHGRPRHRNRPPGPKPSDAQQ